MAKEIKNKRGQMTIWVIIAVVFVAVIVLFFLLRSNINPNVSVAVEENPRVFISNCVSNYVNEAVDIILPHGGFANPGHSKFYNDINVSYLCYNKGNYNPCVNQHPLLLNEMKKEIQAYAEPRIEQCFQDYKFEMAKREIIVDLEPMALNVEIVPDKILVDLDRRVTITNRGESYSLNEFNVEVLNPVYDLGRIAMEIASQEAEYCYFEYVGYMILYPKYKIEKIPMSDSTNIYTIQDKKSGKQMNIAVRSCAIPAGF